MPILKIDHIAINSYDIEKSIQFYCDILGLAPDKCVDMGEVVLHYFKLPDGSTLEMFDYKDRTKYTALSKLHSYVEHIAFEVTNIEKLNRKLIENNIKFEMNMCVLEQINRKALLCVDPDGVIVELTQKI